MIDLHTHSAVSDGTDTPAELMAAAAAAGVTTLALTDHDTTAGWDEAARALRRPGSAGSAGGPAGLTLIRGAEFSTRSPDGRGGDVTAHLLGYLFDPAHPAIVAEQARLRESRRERVRRMGALMAADGLPVDGEELLARLAPDSPAGRPHLARVLVDAEVVGSVAEAFDDILGKGGPYYVEKQDTPVATAVEMVRAAGGVPVFAHAFARHRGPCVDAAVLVDLAAKGLGGIEVDHPDHGDADRAELRDLAVRHGLLATGSSDYHGTNKSTSLAAGTTDPAVLERLVAQATGSRMITGGD